MQRPDRNAAIYGSGGGAAIGNAAGDRRTTWARDGGSSAISPILFHGLLLYGRAGLQDLWMVSRRLGSVEGFGH